MMNQTLNAMIKASHMPMPMPTAPLVKISADSP
jgi:hypothetical protein